jgi:chromosome segregation ATPase
MDIVAILSGHQALLAKADAAQLEVARLRAELSKSFAETEAAEVKCDNLSASFEVITSRLEAVEAELEIKQVLYTKALAREQAAEAEAAHLRSLYTHQHRIAQEQLSRAEAAERERDAALAEFETKQALYIRAIAREQAALAEIRRLREQISAAEAENGELKVQIRGLQLTATLTPPKESALIILLARQNLRSEQLEGLLDKAAGLYSDDWPDQFQREVEAALTETKDA